MIKYSQTLPNFYGQGFLGDSEVKNPPANAGDSGLIPGLGRSPEEKTVTHPGFLSWKISWTEEPGGLQSMGHKELYTT